MKIIIPKGTKMEIDSTTLRAIIISDKEVILNANVVIRMNNGYMKYYYSRTELLPEYDGNKVISLRWHKDDSIEED